MQLFVTALLATATQAVSLKEGKSILRHDDGALLYSYLEPRVELEAAAGSITIVDDANKTSLVDESSLRKEAAGPVETEAEQIEFVIEEVLRGFSLIDEINTEAENIQLGTAHEEQEENIEEVMEEANDEAAEIIEDADSSSEAADDVEDVMEDAAEAIMEINKGHDREVQKIARTTSMANIANVTVKEQVVNNILKQSDAGVFVNDIVGEQHLPFNVEIPPLNKEGEDDDDSKSYEHKRTVCRDGHCLSTDRAAGQIGNLFDTFMSDFQQFDVPKAGSQRPALTNQWFPY